MPRNSIFVDIGCNVGLAALPVFSMGFRVICFEPVMTSYVRLMQTVYFNRFPPDRFLVVRGAVGKQDGELQLTVPRRFPDNAASTDQNALAYVTSDIYHEVAPMYSLDSWLSHHPEWNPDDISLIKIDTQGFEYPVLQGMANLLRRLAAVRPHQLLVTAEFDARFSQNAGFRPTSQLSFMFGLGYRWKQDGQWIQREDQIHELGIGDVEYVPQVATQ